jgi:hypothetical protein
MDKLETFYIFRETKLDNQINDKLAVRPNIIFETVVQKDPHRGIQHSPHGMNSPHLSTTRVTSVNTQITTATAPPGVNHSQPPYAAAHHDTSFRIVNSNRRPNKVSSPT